MYHLVSELLQGFFVCTHATLVDEQAMAGEGGVPGELAPHRFALLVDDQFEPAAERHTFEALQHAGFGTASGKCLQRMSSRRSRRRSGCVAQMRFALQFYSQ